MLRKQRHIAIAAIAIAWTAALSDVKADELDAGQLTDMSIEQLSQVKVTSAAKREQSLKDVSSAIFVITQQDIRRSTATAIPELLRMVPGLYVAQVNAHTWSITSRGFGGVFANKLLVLMDGRTVYSPLFSGTYWEVQDYPLGDIDRIEVIRGPGGTLWGSNAVSGVINIITKRASDTQGTAVSISSGKEINGIGDARYGFKIDDVAARIYGRGRVVDDSQRVAGGPGDDGFTSGQGGFKAEKRISDDTALTVQGDVYSLNGAERLTALLPVAPYGVERGRQYMAKGGNFLTKLETAGFSGGDRAKAQLYFDRTIRDELTLGSSVNIFDFDSQYELLQFKRHKIIFGGGARAVSDNFAPVGIASITRQSRDYHLVNTFIQDEVTAIPDTLSFLAGLKFEHNEFTGPVWQPSLRTTWHPATDYTVWGAISRAVRIPSRVANDIKAPVGVLPPGQGNPLPTLLQFSGSHSVKPEEVITYETGLRTTLSRAVSIDTTAFFSDFNNLETFDGGQPALGILDGYPVVELPLQFQNNGRAHVYGIENVLEWTPSSEARLQVWHSMQIVRPRVVNGSVDPILLDQRYNNPVTQLGIRGQFDLPYSLELNPFVRFVDGAPHANAQAYWEAQIQLALKASDRLRFALNVNHALRENHFEYKAESFGRPETAMERSFFITAAYQY